MKQNVIFDFGNVLVRFDPYTMCAPTLSDADDIRMVSDVVFDRAYWDRLDLGTITDEEVLAASLARLPLRLHEAAKEIYMHWYERLPVIDGMDALVRRLKEEGRGLYLLSNISRGFADCYHTVPPVASLLSCFDGLVLSGPLGIVKPQSVIFRHLLDTYHLSPDSCIFVDDSERNVRGARDVGIESYLFDGNADTLSKYLDA